MADPVVAQSTLTRSLRHLTRTSTGARRVGELLRRRIQRKEGGRAVSVDPGQTIVFEVRDGAVQTVAIYSNREAAEKHAADLNALGVVADIAETVLLDVYSPEDS